MMNKKLNVLIGLMALHGIKCRAKDVNDIVMVIDDLTVLIYWINSVEMNSDKHKLVELIESFCRRRGLIEWFESEINL